MLQFREVHGQPWLLALGPPSFTQSSAGWMNSVATPIVQRKTILEALDKKKERGRHAVVV